MNQGVQVTPADLNSTATQTLPMTTEQEASLTASTLATTEFCMAEVSCSKNNDLEKAFYDLGIFCCMELDSEGDSDYEFDMDRWSEN